MEERRASRYRKLFINVVRRLSKDEAVTLAYIYDVIDIPSSYRKSSVGCVIYVFKSMEKKGLLSPDDSGIAFLQEMLEAIDRIDLKKICQAKAKGRTWLYSYRP